MTIGPSARVGLLGVAVALAVVAGPASLLATLAPADRVASFGLDAELSRLGDVRERLVRRRALAAALKQRVDRLAHEIDALQARREQTWAILHDERDEALALERRLDRLVPRVLARSAAVRERRERAARLLADLASTSRRTQLDPTVRARMLAISPLMLQRLQSAESGLAVLARRPDRLLIRHRELELRAPQLMADGQRLQTQREQMQRQRQVAVAQLERVSAEVQGLGSEQQQLASRVLSSEAAHGARAGPRADQPALPDRATRSAGDVMLDAAVKGLLPEQPQLAFAVHAVQPAPSQLAAVVADSLGATPSGATYAEFSAVAPPPAKPLDTLLKGEFGSSLADMTPLDVVFLTPEPLADARSRVAPARLQAPIMPIPGEVGNPFSDQGSDASRPGIRIVAAPGQAVAAPEDGRVVFAGPFKSYGLLLIIEHQREYHTLLWGFSTLDVEVGDRVRTGQIVGVMADAAERFPELHVEVRRNGRPVNPLPWLAASNNKVRG